MFVPIIHQQRRDWIHSCVSTNDKIIEVGCAENPIWGGTQYDVTTVDIKPHPDYMPNIVGPAEDIPVEDKSFDAVCLAEILEHVKDPSVVLKEALRICRDKIIITVPNEAEWFAETKPYTHPEHLRYYDIWSVINFIGGFGLEFSVVKIYAPGWSWFGIQIFKNKPIDKNSLTNDANRLFCTADQIGVESGGGVVTYNELAALDKLWDNGRVEVINGEMVRMEKFGVQDDPFLVDYHTDEIVSKMLVNYKIKLAHFYSNSFSKTVKTLRKSGAFVSFTIAAHNKLTSIEEFRRMGMNFPYAHITDPRLWATYTAGHVAADLIICPSTSSANCMRELGCNNIKVIPHGIDLPNSVKPIPQRFQVTYLGQVGPDKGLVYLLRAWKKLGLKDANLVLAGRNAPDLLPWIRSEGGGNIQVMGWVENKSQLFESCSVYVQPSVTEGFGIEIPEAMGYGRPVIASIGAGASELIENKSDGFVVPIRDPDAIAERIQWCYNNRDKLTEMGLKGRKKAELLTWDKIQDEYIKTWRSFLE